MSAPFFSVITVCRNAGPVIAATAESVQAQECTDYEWIVVDGNSTDDTCEIARRYLDAGRDRMISEPDDGVYHGMNKGLKLARGSYVLFLNAGDTLAEGHTLSRVRASIDDTVDVLHGDVVFRRPSGERIYRGSREVVDGVNRKVLASHQSVYVRRELHLRHPFDTRLKISADFAALASLHAAGARFRHLPTALSVTGIEPEAISVKGRSRMAWEDCWICRHLLGLPAAHCYAAYLKTRARIAAVSGLLALPPWAFRLLPGRLRKRVY